MGSTPQGSVHRWEQIREFVPRGRAPSSPPATALPALPHLPLPPQPVSRHQQPPQPRPPRPADLKFPPLSPPGSRSPYRAPVIVTSTPWSSTSQVYSPEKQREDDNRLASFREPSTNPQYHLKNLTRMLETSSITAAFGQGIQQAETCARSDRYCENGKCLQMVITCNSENKPSTYYSSVRPVILPMEVNDHSLPLPYLMLPASYCSSTSYGDLKLDWEEIPPTANGFASIRSVLGLPSMLRSREIIEHNLAREEEEGQAAVLADKEEPCDPCRTIEERSLSVDNVGCSVKWESSNDDAVAATTTSIEMDASPTSAAPNQARLVKTPTDIRVAATTSNVEVGISVQDGYHQRGKHYGNTNNNIMQASIRVDQDPATFEIPHLGKDPFDQTCRWGEDEQEGGSPIARGKQYRVSTTCKVQDSESLESPSSTISADMMFTPLSTYQQGAHRIDIKDADVEHQSGTEYDFRSSQSTPPCTEMIAQVITPINPSYREDRKRLVLTTVGIGADIFTSWDTSVSNTTRKRMLTTILESPIHTKMARFDVIGEASHVIDEETIKREKGDVDMTYAVGLDRESEQAYSEEEDDHIEDLEEGVQQVVGSKDDPDRRKDQEERDREFMQDILAEMVSRVEKSLAAATLNCICGHMLPSQSLRTDIRFPTCPNKLGHSVTHGRGNSGFSLTLLLCFLSLVLWPYTP